MAGRFGTSAAFTVSYIYTAELFPTVVRSTAMGCTSVSARAGGIIAPIVVLLGARCARGTAAATCANFWLRQKCDVERADINVCSACNALANGACISSFVTPVQRERQPSLPCALTCQALMCAAGQTGGVQFVSFLVFGATMVLAGILAAALPETMGIATPETLNSQPSQRGAADDVRMVRIISITS